MRNPYYDDYYNPQDEQGGDDIAQLVMALLHQLGLSKQDSPDSTPYNGLQPQDEYFSSALRGNRPQEDPYQGGGFGSGSSLMDLLRNRESSGNYRATNNLGYTGAYQFGAPALETVGYLRKGVGRQGNRALDDPKNWTIPGGKEAFLSNPQLQNQAMQKLMSANKSALQKMGLIKSDTDPKIVNAMLSAAHLSGPGGVKKLMRGGNPRDAYGTGAKEYFNLGLKAR